MDVKNKKQPSSTSDNEIIKQNIDLVHKIARNYSKVFNNQFEDLVQVGSIGLFNAIKRYNPKKNASFRTYAYHLITSEIKHYLRDQVPMVRPPRELQELMTKVRKAEQQLSNELNREATQEEVANQLNISISKLSEVKELEKTIFYLSLDQKFDSESALPTLEKLADKKYYSFQLAQDDRILLGDAMSNIKDQSRQVIEFAFYQDLTQTEIAKHLGISQMQVSRRLKKALKELWETLNTRVTPW